MGTYQQNRVLKFKVMAANNSSSIPSAATAITAEQCANKILQVIPEITHFLRDEVRQYGKPRLSLSQLRILYFLDHHPQSSLSEVAEYLDVTRPTMSGAIERLVKQGFVTRTGDPIERRRILLSLTSAGGKYQQQVYQSLLDRIGQKLNSLSDEDTSKIMAGLLLLETIFCWFDNDNNPKKS